MKKQCILIALVALFCNVSHTSAQSELYPKHFDLHDVTLLDNDDLGILARCGNQVGMPPVPSNTCKVTSSPMIFTTCARRPLMVASSS